METVLRPTVDELERERQGILEGLPMDEADLRLRAESFLLTREEARALRRLDQISYLLGED